jgi:D-glycero-alpha-D-manno-heptose-7-phosphate kinase
MIISRTPVRISFFGGGTDLRDFYSTSYGAVLSTAIKKYIYVAVNRRFDEKIRVSYSETETVDSADQVKHSLIKECLKTAGIDKQIEIVTIADVPGHGTGLGSSSSLAVGTIIALKEYTNKPTNFEEAAKEACKIEIGTLKKPIGKQDQYIAALGGFRYIRFNADETVSTYTINLGKNTLEELETNLVSFYIPGSREGDVILADQRKNIPEKMKILEEMRNQAETGKEAIKNGDLSSFGKLLDKAWQLKSTLSNKISNPTISKFYRMGMDAGALGGKLSGAGGSGFLTFYCDKEHQKGLREALRELKEMKIKLEPGGSSIVYKESD